MHILYLVALVTVLLAKPSCLQKCLNVILYFAVLVKLVMFSYDICRFSLKNMSMSLIKMYRTPTSTNERLPAEQQNGYHGFATEQFTVWFIEGDNVI